MKFYVIYEQIAWNLDQPQCSSIIVAHKRPKSNIDADLYFLFKSFFQELL